MIAKDNHIYLTYEEVVPAIMSKSNYDVSKSRGTIEVEGLGGNGRSVLIKHESLGKKYKDEVVRLYGDPHAYIARQPILKALVYDTKAYEYYLNYRLPNGLQLPAAAEDAQGNNQIDYVSRYTWAASWLNMLVRLTANKAAIKRELNITIAEFWEIATDMMRLKEVSLPLNPKRLKEKMGAYTANGYECLVEAHKFGNDYSKKTTSDSDALLAELLAAANKHDDTVIASVYNQWATEHQLPSISPGTVRYRRKKWEAKLHLEREGISKTASKLGKTIQRKRASAPLVHVNSDDNVFDVYFKTPTNQWYRPKIYVVIDTYNDYILGYAYGDEITVELVKDAYRNALQHVVELTGGAYCWHQVSTDRWAISGKNTTPLEKFYRSMGAFTPAAVGNAQSKYIERSFGTTWHQHLKALFPEGYSGHNLTAKEQINTDNRKPSKFLSIEELPDKLETFINSLRAPKLKEWLEGFAASDKSKARLLEPAARLQIFGETVARTTSITAKGVSTTIAGEKMQYELSQEQIFNHIGKTVQVIYDPNNLSQVLITDGKGLRIVSEEYQLVPSALADYEAGDADRIKRLQAEKKTLMPMIQSFVNDRKLSLERQMIDAESRLQAGVLTKGINHKDQELITSYMQGNRLETAAKTAQNDTEKAGVRAEDAPFKNLSKPLNKPKSSIYDKF